MKLITLSCLVVKVIQAAEQSTDPNLEAKQSRAGNEVHILDTIQITQLNGEALPSPVYFATQIEISPPTYATLLPEAGPL